MTRERLTRIVLSLGAAMVIASQVSATNVWELTQEELDCAASLGIELRGPATASSPTFERHLAWLSDAVIYGTVDEIQHDIRGPYATIVKINVLSVKKGEVAGPSVRVNLYSGPRYHEPLGAMVNHSAEGEPGFTQGETVLLFLHTTAPQLGNDPSFYALAADHYLLTGSTKWIVQGRLVEEDGNSAHTHAIDWMDQEIDLVEREQATMCGGE